jgi:diguanylate cyclase (GGDEF)-like protein
MRGTEKVGALDLKARPGQRWRPAQMGLIRTAAGALGAALGTRLELQRLRHQPGRDAVTGLPDERAFHARVSEELARARRHGLALAVALIEIDHFPQIVARYGRDPGNEVLAETTLALKLALRDSDVLARFEGGCFAVLLPETASGPALRCADRLQRTLEEHRFARVARVSATAAVATSPRDGLDTLELLERVTSALQVARKSGQRRVASPAPASLQ